MMRELEAFFTKDEAELGKIEISRRGDRFCLAVGPKGAAWVHAHTNQTAFWRRLSRPLGGMVARWTSCWQFLTDTATGCMWRNCTTANLTGSSLLKTDSRDAYRYCIADEGCHLTYHRFTKEDYEAFGF